MSSVANLSRGGYVDIGGRRLYLDRQGEGTPTVVFENGLGVSLEGWANIQPEVARFTRTIAYERAGIGRSDPATGPVDAITIARDLHAALEAAGERGPYVLVGHSLGGVLIRLFAHLYPGDVAGLVFVDASHPEQESRIPIPRVMRAMGGVLKAMPTLARLRTPGFGYLVRRTMGSSELPPDAAERSVGFALSPDHLSAVAREYRALSQMFAQGRMTGSLGDLPIAIVSAGSPEGKLYDAVRGLHRELGGLSTRSTVEVVPGATHMSIITSRSHALAVVEAIRRIVDEARASSSA